MRALWGIAVAAALLLAPSAQVLAQQTDGVLFVDRDRVLAESVPARALRKIEEDRRRALRSQFDEVQKQLEAEEAEIADLRGRLSAAEFEARVREFDQKVREARRSSQAAGEALQSDIVAARRQLTQALIPVLQALMRERGAAVILDANSVLLARSDIDATREAIERFNAVEFDFGVASEETEGGE